MKIRLLDVAEEELDAAFEWYEAKSPGLGARFISEVRVAGKMIARYPEAWHSLGSGARRYRLNRFPYGLIYFIEPTEIVIVAVAHHHRKPGY